jgi:hypothetical protein
LEKFKSNNQKIPMIRKYNLLTITILAACAMLALTASADDKKADPTGTWTWTTPGRNGGADRTNTLTLKVEASKLTGKLATPARGGGAPTETEIKEGKIDDGAISFAIIMERNGNSITNSYSGKISGDTITGKMEYSRNGEPATRDWKATRSTDAKPADAK